MVSSLSPLCVLLWRELTGIQVRRKRGRGQPGRARVFGGGSKTDAPFPVAQPGTSLLTLMGFRLEGIFPAALLPLLLTMVSPALSSLLFLVISTRLLFVTVFLSLIVSFLTDGRQEL